MFVNSAEPSLWFAILQKQREKQDPGQQIKTCVEKAASRREAVEAQKAARKDMMGNLLGNA